jgi:mRNA interferase RelE/StbE
MLANILNSDRAAQTSVQVVRAIVRLRQMLASNAELESNPRPPDVKKLKGRNAWRIRVGDYRVIYEIHDRELHILVITVGHRREVYR